MIPKWVSVGDGSRVDKSVTFIPYNSQPTVIGKGCIVDSGAAIYGGVEIGNDSIIGHNTVLRFNTKIGVHSIVANLSVVEGNCEIGDHSLIHSQCHVAQLTRIGDYVFMAPLCSTANDPVMYYYRKEYSREGGDHWSLLTGPTICDAARIGLGVRFFPKIRVGTHAVVGMGAVVTKDVPDYDIVFGIPASHRGIVDPHNDLVVKCKRDHS